MKSYFTPEVFPTERDRFGIRAYVVVPTRRKARFPGGWRFGFVVDSVSLQVYLVFWRFVILWKAKS